MYNRAMVVEPLGQLPAAVPPQPGPFRVEDYLALPDEPRCELLFGELVVTPAPGLPHQGIVGELYLQLVEFRKRAGGSLWLSPIDVVLAQHTVVQPDLCWLSPERRDRCTRPRIVGAPDLLVEVVSPSSKRRDRVWKLDLYRRTDVRELWLVDGEGLTVDFLTPADERVAITTLAAGIYDSPTISGLALDLDRLWQESRTWQKEAD